jgi:hypothetical protein
MRWARDFGALVLDGRGAGWTAKLPGKLNLFNQGLFVCIMVIGRNCRE